MASQFAALCVGAQPGQKVADLCAAPGGKSLTLAECMQNQGKLISGEYVESRVPLLRKAFARCGVTCAKAVQNDAAQLRSDWGKFDRILCDVPCSGLGVIAKKPDIRYKDLDGIENLLLSQQKILQNGADLLAENGRLVYSTCTVNRDVYKRQTCASPPPAYAQTPVVPMPIISGSEVAFSYTCLLYTSAAKAARRSA